MAVKEILRLGNPELLLKSVPVKEDEIKYAIEVGVDLKDTVMKFQEEHGWGRAIAAPQIGVRKRILFWQLQESQLFINPEIVESSKEMIEIWDDCMSFPDLLVKVKRYKSCSVKFLDDKGELKIFRLNGNESELIQHELDHLDGILATMRAIDGSSFCLKSESHLLKDSEFSNTIQI